MTGFLCPISANTFGIEFTSFIIRDYDTKRVVFEVSRDKPPTNPPTSYGDLDEDSYRRISYDFSVDVLRLPTISTL